MQILGWKSYASDVYPLLCADILTKPCDLVRFLPSHCQHRSVRVYFRTGFLPFLSSCISFFCHSYLICFPSLLIVSLHLLFFYFAPPPLFLRYFRTLREKHQLALSCRSVRLSVCRHLWARLPGDGFSWNSTVYFHKNLSTNSKFV